MTAKIIALGETVPTVPMVRVTVIGRATEEVMMPADAFNETLCRSAAKSKEAGIRSPAAAAFSDGNVGMTWHVLTVAANRERLVAERLTALGHEGYVPREHRYVRVSRHARSKRPVTVTMLPGYCFARVRHDASWMAIRDIRSLSGDPLVFGALMASGRPAVVGDDEVLALMAAEVSRYVPGGGPRMPTIGTRVDVVAGPMQGLSGTVGAVGLAKVKALLPMFGSLRLVEVPIDAIEWGEMA